MTEGRRRPRLAAAAVVLVLSALPTAAAQAAIGWAPCSGASRQCATVPVPLDPSGATPGTINLKVQRQVPASNPANTAIVALAGGPGQAALPLFKTIAKVLAPGIGTQDLVIFDQRGTGSSGALTCDALDNAKLSDSVNKVTSACATELGPDRAFYTTAQSVADIEALRVAGGYSKITLFGVSYGTKVAEEYAQTYPQNVAGLILDSVVTPAGPDPLQLTTYAAIRRILHDLCADQRCAHATPSVSADFAAIVKKSGEHPISASVPVFGSGLRLKLRVDPGALFQLLLAGDFNPILRAEFPAALHSARVGDDQPLVRLAVDGAGINAGLAADDEAENVPLLLDTTCEESPLPWPRTLIGASQRHSDAKAAIVAAGAAAIAPFSATEALDQGPQLTLCAGWPAASPAPAPLGPLPQVPALVIEGQADLRTTVADATAVAAAIPGSSLLVVPHNGHSVLTTDQSGCAEAAVKAFFTAQPVVPCAADANLVAPTPRAPHSLATIDAHGAAQKTAVAARLTVDDEVREFIASGATSSSKARAGGLRGGYARIAGSKLELVRASYVRGVDVSGAISLANGSGTVTLSGAAAAPGRIHFGPRHAGHGTVTGTLGGHHVHLSFGAVAARAASTGTGSLFPVDPTPPVILGR